jgi:hypothetical protein
MNEMLVGRMRPNRVIRDHSEFFAHARVGNVPFGWKVERLRDLFRLKNGKSNITANFRGASGDEFCFPVFGGKGMTGWNNRYFLWDETIVTGLPRQSHHRLLGFIR